jgi:hypothetical protein
MPRAPSSRGVSGILVSAAAAFAAAAALPGSAATSAAAAVRPDAHRGEVVLEAHDGAGRRLGFTAFRRRQENGRGEVGDNDMLLDPTALTVIRPWPLYSATGTGDGDPALRWPGRPAALALAWPTAQGYSNLIVDLPGPGRYDLEALAARQAGAAIDRMLAARPAYRPSRAFGRDHDRLRTLLGALRGADGDVRGRLGVRALDAATTASLRLLAESGIERARLAAPGALQWGFTLDTVRDAPRSLRSVAELAPGDAWVRIVFDRAEPPAAYRAAVDLAHGLGVRVMGQILDSSQMKDVPLAAWRRRVDDYVTALPDVDEWEVGNEVNGTWLGRDVIAKVAYAARTVRARTSARTLLTLFWELGEDQPRSSIFEWASRHLQPELMRDIDDVGISLYPEDHPLGLATNRVFETLHARFPAQRLLISELGYWSADLGHTWWWGSRIDPEGRARVAVASLYQAASLSYPFSAGGTYWWYYRREALDASPLRDAFAGLHARTRARP